MLPQGPFIWQAEEENGVNKRNSERFLRVWRGMKKWRCSLGGVDVVHKTKRRLSCWDALIGGGGGAEPGFGVVAIGPPNFMFLKRNYIEERFGG